jgi:hypothetical protein
MYNRIDQIVCKLFTLVVTLELRRRYGHSNPGGTLFAFVFAFAFSVLAVLAKVNMYA